MNSKTMCSTPETLLHKTLVSWGNVLASSWPYANAVSGDSSQDCWRESCCALH